MPRAIMGRKPVLTREQATEVQAWHAEYMDLRRRMKAMTPRAVAKRYGVSTKSIMAAVRGHKHYSGEA